MISRIVAVSILLLGCVWSFQRGANDFSVFYEAWRLVLLGKGSTIYYATPDRFLYAPGFAWLFSPLGFFSYNVALFLWDLMKFGAGLWMISVIGPWGIILAARPILIDFQYGQVNFLILAGSLAALRSLFLRSKSSQVMSWKVLLPWIGLVTSAIVKIFPLPLLLLLGLSNSTEFKQARAIRVGTLIGLVVVLTLPAPFLGFNGTQQIYHGWAKALMGRGLPTDSHNQSFAAFLHHLFSGESTQVLSEAAARSFYLGVELSKEMISKAAFIWASLTMGFLIYWISRGFRLISKPTSRLSEEAWIALCLGMLIVPSHLVWKPYFVFSIPLFAFLAKKYFLASGHSFSKWIVLVCFIALNLSGFDFVGHEWGGRFEAASVMFWAHLLLIGAVLRDPA